MILGLSTPWALFIAGILTQTWLFNRFSKLFGNFVSLISMPFGIYAFVLAIYLAIQKSSDTFSIILLALAGITLFSKPLKKVKWAAFLATLIGALLTYSVSQLFLEVPLILLLLTFSVLTLMAYLVFKFAEDLIQTVGQLLNLPPVSAAIGALCIIKAFMLVI